MPFRTAQEKSTITQIEAKAVFFQREFGINTDLPALSRHRIQNQNPGTMAAATQSKAMFSVCLMLDGVSVMTL